MAVCQVILVLFLLFANVDGLCKVFDSIKQVSCQHSNLNDLDAARIVWLYRTYRSIDLRYNNIKCVRFARSHVLLLNNPVDCGGCPFPKLVVTVCSHRMTTGSTTSMTTQSSTLTEQTSLISTQISVDTTIAETTLLPKIMSTAFLIDNLTNKTQPSMATQITSEEEMELSTTSLMDNFTQPKLEPPILPSYQPCDCQSFFTNPKTYLIGLAGYVMGILTLMLFATIKMTMKGKYLQHSDYQMA